MTTIWLSKASRGLGEIKIDNKWESIVIFDAGKMEKWKNGC